MSPRTKQQNQYLREASRAAILASALALFARHGYSNTSIRMIAQDAGVSQGLLYNYFAGKEQVLTALFQRSMQDVRASFVHAEQSGDPHTHIAQLIRASLTIVRQHQSFWKLAYALRLQPDVLASLGDDLPCWMNTIQQTLARYLAASGAEHPAIEAAVLFALIDGVGQHYVLDPERYPLDAVIEAMIAHY